MMNASRTDCSRYYTQCARVSVPWYFNFPLFSISLCLYKVDTFLRKADKPSQFDNRTLNKERNSEKV